MNIPPANRADKINKILESARELSFQTSIQGFQRKHPVGGYQRNDLTTKLDHQLDYILMDLKEYREYFESKRIKDVQEKNQRWLDHYKCDVESFKYWQQQAYWNIQEAVFLSFGLDPRKIEWSDVDRGLLHGIEVAQHLNDLKETVRRYIVSGYLSENIRPEKYRVC